MTPVGGVAKEPEGRRAVVAPEDEVGAEAADKNAQPPSDLQNARIERGKALGRIVTDVLRDDT